MLCVATIEGVRAQIRFHLSELGTRNQHHDFERLCREFARVRICRQILASTGPVSAGGDQGRDFETFRDYLRNCGLGAPPFLGVADSALLVFACTVQKQSLFAKMSSDLDKILDGATRPTRVYFFMATSVTDSIRHKIQARATELGTAVEVFDQQTLSEQLSDLDLFWIAQEYLHIASEIYPPLPADPRRAKYEAAKRDWSAREPLVESFADFEELRRSLRVAARVPELRGDVEFFCRKLQRFRSSPIDALRRRTIYETAVAHVRAHDSLRGDEDALREYLATQSGNSIAAKDHICLLFYVIGAWKRKVVDVSEREIASWKTDLTRRFDLALRSKTLSSSEHCILLDHRGKVCLAVTSAGVVLGALAGAFKYWKKMLRLLPKAPLFPIEEFSDYVGELVPLLAQDPNYRPFVARLDKLVAQRAGRKAAAHSAYQRALAWRRAGKEREAINELHSAKVDWFSEETLGLCASSLLEIGRWYTEIGLTYASKYYAMAASYITLKSNEHDLLRCAAGALLVVADCEYFSGAWGGFLVWARAAVPLLTRIESQTSGKLDEEINRLAFHGFTALYVTQLLNLPELAPSVRAFLREIGFDDLEGEVLPKAAARWPDAASFLTDAKDQLAGIPFCDTGVTREIAWRALGIEWRVSFENNYETSARAEEFVALYQVLLADLSSLDLSLLPTTVTVSLSVGDGDATSVERVPTNTASQWRVVVPLRREVDTKDLLIECFKILREVSLAPQPELSSAVERVFANGLSAKIFVARSYRDLVLDFVSRKEFDSFPRTSEEHVTGGEFFREHSDLAWNDGLRPDYDNRESERMIRRRYDKSMEVVHLTLPRLQQSGAFRSAVSRLRSEGWKDWHILMAVAAVAANARLDIAHGPPRTFAEAKKSMAEFYRPEKPDDPVLGDELFTFQSLERQALFNLASSAKVLGLELHQATPDVSALKRFLAAKYNYMSDDVPHAPIFVG